MTPDRLLSVLLRVLTSREVIIVTIVIALYVNLVMYVVYYRKRPVSPKPRRRREKPAAAPAKEEAEVEDEE